MKTAVELLPVADDVGRTVDVVKDELGLLIYVVAAPERRVEVVLSILVTVTTTMLAVVEGLSADRLADFAVPTSMVIVEVGLDNLLVANVKTVLVLGLALAVHGDFEEAVMAVTVSSTVTVIVFIGFA